MLARSIASSCRQNSLRGNHSWLCCPLSLLRAQTACQDTELESVQWQEAPTIPVKCVHNPGMAYPDAPGVRAQGDALPLSQEACAALAAASERPMLFALSQPGVLSPEDAFAWTGGRCIFTDGQLVGPRWTFQTHGSERAVCA